MNIPIAKHISECFIKPKYEVEDSKYPYYLSPWDLAMLSFENPQYGLLFAKPPLCSIENLLESLKESLSLTLVHFYPLAGQLVNQVDEDRHECVVFVDCKKGPGVRFIYTTLHIAISDILSPTYVPPIVRSLFDQNKIVGHDGHTQPLFSVQVTELLDGVFIACTVNHVVIDGTIYWQFWNTWSKIHRVINENQNPILNPRPIHHHRVPDGYRLGITLPFTHPNEFISRYETPELSERVFHFSSSSVATLKRKASEESNTRRISSFQVVAALVWRSIVRANGLSHDQVTNCKLAISNRQRLNPPLTQNYFGNCINIIKANTTAGELLGHNLGWAALLVRQSVASHTNKNVRDFLRQWTQSPYVYQHKTSFDPNSIIISGSPRFDMYGNEFGLGKPLAVRCGLANKFVGKITACPGYEGGSMDFEICLSPDAMKALESDKEFMAAISSPHMMSVKSQDMTSNLFSKM